MGWEDTGHLDAVSVRALTAALAAAAALCALLGGWHALEARRPAIGAIVDTVNPNLDGAVSLQRLPGIGPARAQTIIEHRRQATDRIAFADAADLQRIRGIGPKTVERIAPLLCFDPPAVMDDNGE